MINKTRGGMFELYGFSTMNIQLALAHETVTVGNYDIEFGWLSGSPVVVNAFDISRDKLPAAPKE